MKKIIQIYTDESGYIWNHRFWTIAALAWEKQNMLLLNNEIMEILRKNIISEIKFNDIKWHWSKMKSIKEIIDILIKYIASKRVLLATITWDNNDERHNISWRDDIENFKRMYYHLLKRIKTFYNFEDDVEWEFYPDEHTAIDWEKDIIFYLKNTNLKKKYKDNILLFPEFKDFIFPNIKNHKEIDSKNSWIIQLADLMAWLIRLSFHDIENNTNSLEKFFETKKHENALDLFSLSKNNDIILKISKNKKHKFEILYYFKEKCSRYKLGLNYSKNKYFCTFNQKVNLLVWKYIPKWEYDKAPTKYEKAI